MKLNRILYPLLFLVAVVFVSCEKHKDEPKVSDGITNVTLIYAVNHNNLAYDLVTNRKQILQAASHFDSANDEILLYSYENGECSLKQLIYNQDGSADFKEIEKYQAGVLSTNPERIGQVMSYVATKYPHADKTLFLWGHGMGPVNPQKYSFLPLGNNTKSSDPTTPSENILYSFGGEYVDGLSGVMDYVDIDQLADAIPSGVFRTIWFDCCYMASIEIAYQLRDKCKYFVAYPTEIMEEGLPYHQVLPLTVGNSPDLNMAAEKLYNYYNSKLEPVTVTVMDMSKIHSFGTAVRNYVSTLKVKPSYTGVINYSRLTMPRPNTNIAHPYYDLIGWLRNGGDDVNEDQFNSVKTAYNELIIYTAASKIDFKRYEIDPNSYFGISFYPYNNDNSQRDSYYNTLDWWKDVASHYGWL